MTVIYRIALATFMGFVLTVAIASHSIAQQQPLIGTWLLVSEITEFPDGKRLEGFGGNQKGSARRRGSLGIVAHSLSCRTASSDMRASLRGWRCWPTARIAGVPGRGRTRADYHRDKAENMCSH